MKLLVRLLSILLVPTILAACDTPPSVPSGADVDRGGNVMYYARQVAQLQASGQPYRVARRCQSACAMLMAAESACFPADGTVEIHSVRIAGNQAELITSLLEIIDLPAAISPDRATDDLNYFMAAFFPPRIRTWFHSEGPGATRTQDFTVFHNRDLALRGEVTLCE